MADWMDEPALDPIGYDPDVVPPGETVAQRAIRYRKAQLGQLPPMADTQTAPQSDPLQLLEGLGIRLPKEAADRIRPMLVMAQGQIAARQAGLDKLGEYTTGLQTAAKDKMTAFQTEANKPLPINAAMMGLNSAVGEFADMLAPKRGFRQAAEQRRMFEIGQLKERRIARLQMMEKEAMAAANRADEMGDIMAKQKAMNDAEKQATLISAAQGTLKDYYKAKDEKDLAIQKAQARMDELAYKYGSKIAGNGSGKDPAVQQRLTVLNKVFDSDIAGIDDEIKSIRQDMMTDSDEKDQKIGALIKQRAARIQKHLMDTEGVISEFNSLTTPPETPETRPVLRPAELQKLQEASRYDYVLSALHGGEDISSLANTIDKKRADPEGRAELISDFGLPEGASNAQLDKVRGSVLAEMRKVQPIYKRLRDLEARQKGLQATAGKSYGGIPITNTPLFKQIANEQAKLYKRLLDMGYPTQIADPDSNDGVYIN